MPLLTDGYTFSLTRKETSSPKMAKLMSICLKLTWHFMRKSALVQNLNPLPLAFKELAPHVTIFCDVSDPETTALG